MGMQTPHCSVQRGLLASPLVGFAKQSKWYLVGEVVCGRANAGVEKPWERYREQKQKCRNVPRAPFNCHRNLRLLSLLNLMLLQEHYQELNFHSTVTYQ